MRFLPLPVILVVCCLSMPNSPVSADERSLKTLSPFFFMENGDEDAERFPLKGTIELAENESHGDDRDFILNYRLSGDQIHSGLMVHNGQKEKFFTLMVQPPERATLNAIPAREYIFVIELDFGTHRQTSGLAHTRPPRI